MTSYSRSVLVVEDSPAFRELVSTVLVQAGYAVREAGSAEEALAVAAEERPAVVLLDVILPDVSGYQVCRALRAQFGETLPIIFLSGSREHPLDVEAGLLMGADDYILKPFVAGDLVARVRRAMTRSAEHHRNGLSGLTLRELEVLNLLAEGLSQDAIADRLVISPKTVATHIQRILSKLGVHSRAEAVAQAYRLGVVENVVDHRTDSPRRPVAPGRPAGA